MLRIQFIRSFDNIIGRELIYTLSMKDNRISISDIVIGQIAEIDEMLFEIKGIEAFKNLMDGAVNDVIGLQVKRVKNE